jgi:ribonucleotide monophosphatase NagD (HAD superfamily)
MTAPFAAPTALALAALSAGASVVIEAEGVLWDGRTAHPGAPALLGRFAERAAIVSNDARHTTEAFAARLAAAGLRAPPERVLTAGSAVIAAAATRFTGQRVMLLAPRGLVAAARALGIEPAIDQVAAVVVADDTDVTWSRLAAAAAALAAGVPCLVACTEPRSADGAPGPGALVAALRAAVPDAVMESLGLPGPGLLRHAAARAGSAGGAAVLIAEAARAEAAQAAGMHLLPADHARLSLAAAIGG